MSQPDPLRYLQAAARTAAEHICPGQLARRVIVLGEGNVKLLDAAVPLCACQSETRSAEPAVTPGWFVQGETILFDGDPVPVRGRNLDVLRLLVAGDVVSVDALRAAW